jgi:hypothetical protein
MRREWALRSPRRTIDQRALTVREEAAVAVDDVFGSIPFLVYCDGCSSGGGLPAFLALALVLDIDAVLVPRHAGVAIGLVVAAADGEKLGLGRKGGRKGGRVEWVSNQGGWRVKVVLRQTLPSDTKGQEDGCLLLAPTRLPPPPQTLTVHIISPVSSHFPKPSAAPHSFPAS